MCPSPEERCLQELSQRLRLSPKTFCFQARQHSLAMLTPEEAYYAFTMASQKAAFTDSNGQIVPLAARIKDTPILLLMQSLNALADHYTPPWEMPLTKAVSAVANDNEAEDLAAVGSCSPWSVMHKHGDAAMDWVAKLEKLHLGETERPDTGKLAPTDHKILEAGWDIINEAKARGSIGEKIMATALELALLEISQQKQIDSGASRG